MELDSESEQQLVERAKTEKEAFGQLFDRYYSKIFGYVLKRTGDVAVAEDLVSETFFKAMKNIKKFQWRGVSFSAWLYRIATNEVNMFYRRSKPFELSIEAENEAHGFDVPDLNTPERDIVELQDTVERHAQYKMVQGHLIKLSEKYQEVITLRYFENKKIHEVAEILGKSPGTIKSLLSRGVHKLKALMDSDPQPFLQQDIILDIDTETDHPPVPTYGRK